MHVYDQRLADLVFDYLRERLARDPVPLDRPVDPEMLRAQLAGLMSEHGHDPAEVLRIYREHLSRAVVSCDSPRYLSFVPAAPTKAALLFDMVVSCASLSGMSWVESAGAIAAENQVLRLLADLAGLPRSAGGCFVSGGSAAMVSALAVARDTARRSRGHGPEGPRLGIAVSDQAHSSVSAALRMLDLRALPVASEDHRLTGRALRTALKAYAASGGDPDTVIGVVATAGTTNAGIVDDLASVAAVARDRGWWFHVDGAYGGAALLAPSVRERFAGVEHADSFVVDPHKWLLAPYDCAALLYRRPELARLVHTQDASYLDVFHRPDIGRWNASDYAHHLSRRARGLPLWFSLAVHGTAAYTEAVEAGLRRARETAELIRRDPDLELVREPELSVVLFRRRGWSAQDYWDWSERLLDAQIGFVVPTRWEGEMVVRMVFLHPRTTGEMVREMLDTLR